MGKHKRKHKGSSREETELLSPKKKQKQECDQVTGPSNESPKISRKKKSKKVKKQYKQKDSEIDTVSSLEVADNDDNGEDHVKKKKKEKKKDEMAAVDPSTISTLSNEASVLMADQEDGKIVKKKTKRKHQDNETNHETEKHAQNVDKKQASVADVSSGEISEKKRKKKKEKRAHESDEWQFKDGIESNENSVNVLTNKEGKSMRDSNTSCNSASATTVGQWGSAEFEDSNRQNKFFRLLGGLKNKDSASVIQNKFQLEKKSNFQPGGGRAMNREQQESYAKTLETDYQKALASNVNRGVGLGFEKPPSEGKKFHIDVNQSKSIKFDD